MRKLKLYLDTSVVSAYHDKRAEERRQATIKFWKEVLPGYQVCISEIIVDEKINNTKQVALRKKLKRLIRSFSVLKVNSKIRDLAQVYVGEGVFADKYIGGFSSYSCSYLL